MKIDYLHVAKFKNLDDLFVDFDETSPTTVLVGRNGTGKSNLLEALTIIFRDLDLGAPPSFRYKIRYRCRGRWVELDADPGRKRGGKVIATVDGQKLTQAELSSSGDRAYLPNYVFGYYSGTGNRMEEHFVKHQERFYRELISGDSASPPLRPLFFARPVHSQFVLLAFFLEQDQKVLEFLNRHLGIVELESVLFVMREPPWKSTVGDPRFWRARGIVRDLLHELYSLALAPIRTVERVPIGFRKFKELEHLYLYLKDVKQLRSLAKKYSTQQDFFKALESTYISEMLKEVRIRVSTSRVEGALTFRELSEGEQQLLMVLGLLRFTREQESLFLLDEPDTHLNPAWSVQYLSFVRDIGGAEENSHIIMATHDPLVVAGLTREQVQIFQRDESGRVAATIPESDPKGMGVAGLLTSDVYGLRSQLDLETLHDLDRKRELATKESLSESERLELAELSDRLGALDFTTTVRDPLYERFVYAMSRIEDERYPTDPVLNAEQREKQRELAVKVLRELMAQEKPD